MKQIIIIPPHKKISQPVKKWKEIKQDAKEMIENIRANQYANEFWREAFAISHCQVSEEPKRFFVVNRALPEVKKAFSHDVIINPEIVEMKEWSQNREGCMSKPWAGTKKMGRYKKIVIRYKVKSLFGFLRKKKKSFEELPAFMIQHELEHFEGKYLE